MASFLSKMSTEPAPEYPAWTNQLLRIASASAMVVTTFWLLLIGKTFLIPLVLAMALWFMIGALNGLWRRVKIAGRPIPRILPALLSTVVIFGIVFAFLSLITANVTSMAASAGTYQEKLWTLYTDTLAACGIEETTLADNLMGQIDLAQLTATIGARLSSLAGDTILIAMYVVFLLLERPFFDTKLCALVKSESKRHSIRLALRRIDHQVKVYLGVKVFVSLITAVGAYIIMRLVKLDFAEFWAVLIFALNFIPYIGSTIATLLPTLLALAQFGSFTQALIIFGGVQAIQMTVGYVVEPTMMGNSLNISPLAVMLALTFWGLLWGITGMFISVPITVIIMIACAHFESSRWVAVVLSKDGAVQLGDTGQTTSK